MRSKHRAALGEQLRRAGLEVEGYDDSVQRVLQLVRVQLGMEVAWVSRFAGAHQVLDYVEAQEGAKAPEPGTELPLSGSFCARVLDGRVPAVIPDAHRHPATALLDVTSALQIGSYLGVPLRGPLGVTVGMLCAINESASPGLDEHDVEVMRLLADVLSDLARRAWSDREAEQSRSALESAVRAVIAGEGRHAVLQPVFDLATGAVVAAEGLTRFTATSPVGDGPRTPSQWFDDADAVGLRGELELATAASVLALLPEVPPDVAVTVNLGPSTLTTEALETLLRGIDPARVVLEVTEHATVPDYEAFLSLLAGPRDAGLRLAIDDTGAGYASLRHVLLCRPEIVKVDMALVRGCDDDPVRHTLLCALQDFAAAIGALVVAEGVETPGELGAVRDCGIALAQGFQLARPSEQPDWV